MELNRRDFALLMLGTASTAGLSGCNTTQPAAVQPQAASGFRVGAISVNTAPLLAQSGDPTASWVQQALPGQLAQAFAAHMAPGDPAGATLAVRIDSIYLGQGRPADPDAIKGAATLSGGAGVARQAGLRAIATYIPTTVDQALWEQALQGRVTTLSQAFAYSLARQWPA